MSESAGDYFCKRCQRRLEWRELDFNGNTHSWMLFDQERNRYVMRICGPVVKENRNED